jgi:large subunit ribosomal protein L31
VSKLKEGIHPQYFKTKVTCACGASFETGSTRKEIRVEICSKCHPMFTGKQRILDSGGQVEKFKKRLEKK